MATPPIPPRVTKGSPSSYSPASLLTICVGTGANQQDFVAHESFLTCRSEFFRRAVNGRWEEAETRVVKLPDDNPEIFALYLECAYTGQISREHREKAPYNTIDPAKFHDLGREDLDKYIKLHVLAEKLLDSDTKHTAIKSMLATVELFAIIHGDLSRGLKPGPGLITFVYDCTSFDSPLRRFFADLQAILPLEEIRDNMESLTKEFLLDVAVALQVRGSGRGELPGAEAYLEVKKNE